MIAKEHQPLLKVAGILCLGLALSYVLGLLFFQPTCVEGQPCNTDIVFLVNMILGGAMFSWTMGIYHHFVVFHKVSEMTPGDQLNKVMWSCFGVCGFFVALTILGALLVFVLPFTFEDIREWAGKAEEPINNFDLYVIFPWQAGNILFGFAMMFVYLRLAYVKGMKELENEHDDG